MAEQSFFAALSKEDKQKPIVFCFPHAGGNSEDYLEWQKYLISCATLSAVCLPGTGRRFAEKHPDDIESLSTEIADEIDNMGLYNYYFFGHSMGAILAYEVAIRVKKLPKALIISSSASPDSVPSLKVISMNAMSDKDFAEEINFFNGIEKNFSATDDFFNFFLKKIRKHFELIGRYKHKHVEKLTIPIYSIVGDRDPHVSNDAIVKWESMTSAGYINHTVPGNHFYFNENPELIASVIRKCIHLTNHKNNCNEFLII